MRKLIAFSPRASAGKDLDYKIILVTDDEFSFSMGVDQAKRLLKQLQNCIGVSECFNPIIDTNLKTKTDIETIFQ